MVNRLTIHAVAAIWSEDGYSALVLAEDPAGNGRHLEIQRALNSAGEAVRDETYALVTDGGATHYGGIVGWKVEGAVLRVTLSSKAAEKLSLSEETEFAIEPGREHIDRVIHSLSWLLEPSSPVPTDVFERV